MTTTCHVWCASHDTDLGFCHSEPTVIAGIDVHLAAHTAADGPTRVYLGTAYGQFELPVQTAVALFHASDVFTGGTDVQSAPHLTFVTGGAS